MEDDRGRAETGKAYRTWEELVAYVRAGGRLPPAHPEGYEGNRTTLVGASGPATPEELVLFFAELEEATGEQLDDPEWNLEMLRRYGCDCIWDDEAGRPVPRNVWT